MSTAKRRGNGEGSNPVQRKDGRWQVHIRYTDELGIGRRTSVLGKTSAEARAKANDVRDRLRASLPAKVRKVTVGVFTSQWIASTLAASDRKPSTKELYHRIARHHIVGSTIGTRPLDKLKPSHVEAWKVELANRGLAESTVRTAYTVLRAVLDTAVRDEALARNPAAAVARPKVTVREAAYLSPAQVRELLSEAASSRYAPVFELLVNTGLRRGEALALTWSDIDFERKLIRVRGTLARVDGELTVTEPKTSKSKRAVHMSRTTEGILRAVRLSQKEDRLKAGSAWVQTPYVFTTEAGQPCDPRNALRALKVAARRAALPTGIGLHTLRHSAATVMIENGVPLKVVSEILGHFSVSITGDIYAHVSPDVSAQAMDALGAALDG
jgi:integrase